MFSEESVESVWHWLERLGVPLRDRGDLVQEVFLAAFLSWNNYDPAISRPERWLNRITVNTSAHYRERAYHRYEELVETDDEEVPDEAPLADVLIANEQERLVVLELLQSLDVELRSILIAHDIDEIPMSEIAEQRGIPISTAYKWRSRAFKAFRAILEEHWRKERGGEESSSMGLIDVSSLMAIAQVARPVPEGGWPAIFDGARDALRTLAGGTGTGLPGAGSWGAALGSAVGAAGVAAAALVVAAVVLAAWLAGSAAGQDGAAAKRRGRHPAGAVRLPGGGGREQPRRAGARRAGAHSPA